MNAITEITNLSEIGLYNQGVRIYINKQELSPILQLTIKNFKDEAFRNKWNEKTYNEEVEKFNNHHGFYLFKKGVEQGVQKNTNTKQYSYINHPQITTDAFRETMQNYRLSVYEYNKQVAIENKEIRKFNTTVKQVLSKEELKIRDTFQTETKSYFTREYNNLAANIKDAKGTHYIPQKRIQNIKYQTEVIFSVLVGFYASQLKQRNRSFKEMNMKTSCEKSKLPHLKIDHRKMAIHQIDGIQRLLICKKTAHNHVKRLREAGILKDYIYINQNKPISVRFSTKVLTVFDGNPPKSLKFENQTVNPSNQKELHHSSDTTRTVLKRNKIKDFAKSKDLELPSETGNETCSTPSFYKDTTDASREKKRGGREILPKFLKSDNEIERLTDKFLMKWQDEQELARLLANGDFDRYQGLRYDYLHKIALYGKLTTEEFKAVIIQDFIKSSAKIWKNHSVYVGDWKNTINYLAEELFQNINSKSVILDKLREYRWKLEFARKWFIKNNFNALFPSLYFDKTRSKPFEVGFFGLHEFWKKHLEIESKKQQNKEKAKYNGSQRKRKLATASKQRKDKLFTKKHPKTKYGEAILKFHLGKIDYSTLYDYVRDNLPNEYLTMLASTINNNITQN